MLLFLDLRKIETNISQIAEMELAGEIEQKEEVLFETPNQEINYRETIADKIRLIAYAIVDITLLIALLLAIWIQYKFDNLRRDMNSQTLKSQ